jgi:hypothetical protein
MHYDCSGTAASASPAEVKLVAQVDGPAERTALVLSQGGRDRAFRTESLPKRRIAIKDLVMAFFGF